MRPLSNRELRAYIAYYIARNSNDASGITNPKYNAKNATDAFKAVEAKINGRGETFEIERRVRTCLEREDSCADASCQVCALFD